MKESLSLFLAVWSKGYHFALLSIISILGCLLLGGIFTTLSSQAFAEQYNIEASDSIAGYGSEIIAKNLPSKGAFSALVKTPTGEEKSYTIHSNTQNESLFVIPKKDTYEAGEYTFVIVPEGFSFEDGTLHVFEVFADDPSPSLSSIKTEHISLATGDTQQITVLIQDKYGNKVEDHRVRLISSRSADIIEYSEGNRTDKNGQIHFTISSSEEGNSRISAFDETANITLRNRENILFYNNSQETKLSSEIFGEGGDDDVKNNNNNISEFRLIFPSTVKINSNEGVLTIKAIDKNGEIYKNFTGTILIRIPGDENADLPAENGKYTFLPQDQGTFSFSRSISFSQAGMQSIEVFLFDSDTNTTNTNIFGKTSVLVKEESGSTGQNSSDINISSPQNNSQFSSSNISVSGQAIKNSDVKVFLDNIPYKTVSTNEKGEFNLIIFDAEEGIHSIYAQEGEGKKKKSSEIQFSVDRSQPQIKDFSFSSTEVSPQEKITLSVETASPVRTVKVFFNDTLAKMIPKDEEGLLWEYLLDAPKTEGEFEVQISLTDKNQITSKSTLNKTITVIKNKISPDILSGEYQEEKKSIVLQWEKEKNTSPILYILHTGLSPTDLKKTKSISGSTTQIEFTQFTEGEEIYFGISAVDEEGKEGGISNLVLIDTSPSFTPTPIPTPKTTPIPTPKATPTPKPDVIEKKDPRFSLQKGKNMLLVSWEENKNTHQYELLYGVQSGKYRQKLLLASSQRSYKLEDLIPGEQYFIRIIAKDHLKNTLFDYGEKEETVGSEDFIGFHPSAPEIAPQPYPQWITQTGPQLFLFLGALFFLFGGIILSRKTETCV